MLIFFIQPTVTSNYIQPSAFSGINNPSLSKTSIIVSTTDADGISGNYKLRSFLPFNAFYLFFFVFIPGYVTHKQLSDYGLKMQ